MKKELIEQKAKEYAEVKTIDFIEGYLTGANFIKDYYDWKPIEELVESDFPIVVKSKTLETFKFISNSKDELESQLMLYRNVEFTHFKRLE